MVWEKNDDPTQFRYVWINPNSEAVLFIRIPNLSDFQGFFYRSIDDELQPSRFPILSQHF